MGLCRSTLLHLEMTLRLPYRAWHMREPLLCAIFLIVLSICLLIGLTGGVVDVEAFSASRDTSGVSLMVEVKEGQQVRADISPFVAFAEIEQAWNMGWVDSIATFFPEEKIALRLDKNAPESAFFTRKQASYMLRDSFRYRATESFKFLEFKYGKSGKKPPLAKAQWSFRREPAGKIIVAKVQVTLRKEGERWLISGIRIQD